VKFANIVDDEYFQRDFIPIYKDNPNALNAH
jgi:hypothetical protein